MTNVVEFGLSAKLVCDTSLGLGVIPTRVRDSINSIWDGEPL
jgi:hypothetical protein